MIERVNGGEASDPSLTPPPDATTPRRWVGAVEPGEMFTRHHPHCFGCGDVANGLGIRSRAEEGLVVTSWFTARQCHQGAPGLLHGGLLIAGFDETLGRPALLLGAPAVAVRVEVDFRRPIPVGTVVWLVNRVDAVSGRKLYVSGQARLDVSDGPIAAHARGLYIRIGTEYVEKGRSETLAVLRD